jgi:hypothetical protein
MPRGNTEMSQEQDTQGSNIEHRVENHVSEQELSLLLTAGPLYRRLSGSEIRLIKLLPGDWDDPIICELVYVRLDDRPKFMALSYAWGDPKKTRPITLNGQAYNITTSLFQGLRRLRRMVSTVDENPETFITQTSENFHLWVDAICINQNDENEKGHQISRMTDIYTYADRVCVWLGENEQEDHLIIYRIMGMAHCVSLAPRFWKPYLTEFFDGVSSDIDRFAQGIIQLTSRKWWSRVWVIQEVCLASKTPIILAGGAWSYMKSLLKLVDIIRTRPERRIFATHSWDFLANPNWLQRIKEDCEKDNTNQEASDVELSSLGARLEKTIGLSGGFFKATLPHDRIYGLLGLVGLETLPYPLTPDYGRPFPQVYQEYARFIIENTGSLSIILREENGMHEVPSWVPDFRSPGAIWRESRPLSHSISFSGNGNRMTVLGVELGICAHIFNPSSREAFHTDPVILAGIQQLDDLIFKSSELRNISRDTALKDWLESERTRQEHDLSIRGLKEVYHSILNEIRIQGRNQQTIHAWTSIARSVGMFSTFVTEDGILASLCRFDGNAQPGDVMVAAKGALAPLLLRPKTENGEYEYLGYCHYRGFEYDDALSSTQVLKQFVIV